MSNEGLTLFGKITPIEVLEALKNAFPDRNFRIGAIGNEAKSVDNDVVIVPFIANNSKDLEKKLEAKNREFRELEEVSHKAGLQIQNLNKQQLELYNEFVLLRQRYDEQKTNLMNVLWTYCSAHHPELHQIPPMEDEKFIENDDEVGDLELGVALGEGQFATVRACLKHGVDTEYALKIIKKERILSFASLLRVSNEIDNLKLLKSPFVVNVCQVMHTATKLYIVTEKGGFDLFEFFDEHQDGVAEPWAKEIIAAIMRGVLYCHEQGICHRDLKPENILLEFDPHQGKCVDLKLCDFGLSTKFKPKVLLTDFCGSPGFFAPEMISYGSYYGDKADVWSIGCILLELIFGHEKFCDVWMSAYDYEILQDKDKFTESIEATADELPTLLNFSEDLNDFILRFLELRSTKRPNLRNLCAHPWLGGMLDEELSKLKTDRDPNRPHLSPQPSSFLIDPADAPNKNENINHNSEAIKKMYNNLSDKERRQMEEYIMHHKQLHVNGQPHGGESKHSEGHAADSPSHTMSLPPIVPQTPSLKNAKKILHKSHEMSNDNYSAPNTHSSTFDSPSPNGHYNSNNNNNNNGPYSPMGMLGSNGSNSGLNHWSSPNVSSKASLILPRVVEHKDELNESGEVKLTILTTPRRSDRRELSAGSSGGSISSQSDRKIELPKLQKSSSNKSISS